MQSLASHTQTFRPFKKATKKVTETKEKIHWSDPKYTAKKRENKSFEAYQQAVLLSFLNQYCSITIEKRRRQPTVTTSIPNIKSLRFEAEEIDVARLAEERCSQTFDEKHFTGKNQQTATRRVQKNKRIFIHNFLLDVLVEKGFFFNSKMSKKSKRGFQLERLKHVFFNNQFIMGKKEIETVGEQVNTILCKLVTDTVSVVTIEKNDPRLMLTKTF
ncbi:hypothetical protein EIN_389900 [Entamoeba invadens IP1]|uniref:Uncharacterized protein n=1 Tax=Entamoeba invadens IP1 TaxID=370355 RepID=A0A0A1U517_ENTIV|nr:hypothetical protein EIN_389900 [Entamoeba invadens IP1]ELP89405.1 hypothetical protein EIN_389900 [Entamoeba invadens IP1]|eukprot:XP_004256176.1 hypothetical protein EIN_389900 [Entamoeba invadens IP1]